MKFLVGLNLFLNSALLFLSQSGTVDAQDFPPCQAEDVMGKVYYTAVMTGTGPVCVKYDLSLGGSIEADFGNDCSKVFDRKATYGTLSSTAGNVATYIPDAGGWSGQVTFLEAPVQNDPAKTVMTLSKFNEGTKKYEVDLFFHSCTAPSVSPTPAPTATPTCPIEEFMGKTYYAPLLPSGKPCIKIDMFSGGTASIDPSNVGCANPYNEVPANVYSTFDTTSDNKALFDGTFTGEVVFEESMTGFVGIEAKLKNFDPNNKSWSLAVVVDSCESPSVAPTPSPSSYPSAPPPSLWLQLGENIVGEDYYDTSGTSMSLSSDGSIVAIGSERNSNATASGSSYYTGHARVYEYDSSTDIWSQLGQDLDGELKGDMFGKSLDLSSDGLTVAISASGHDNGKGHVRVFQYSRSSNTWNQLGQDIDGADDWDRSTAVSLSSDGLIVAIGASSNDGPDDTVSNIGHVRVFEYDGITSSWVQMGLDIYGETKSDQSGKSVSLSADGVTVAIGASTNDKIDTSTIYSTGHVRVYRYDGSVWNQLGQDIDGESAYDYSGTTVSLSLDGSIVAIGAPGNDDNGFQSGQIRVYNYDSGSNLWTQRGDDIIGGGKGYYFGQTSVSLSADGSKLAVGGTGFGDAYQGAAFVYEYNSGSDSWSQLGETIEGEQYYYSGYMVALSSDGYTVAVSSPFGAGSYGVVRVYEADPTQL